MPKRNTTTDVVQAVLSEGRTTLDDLRAELNTPSRKRERERAKKRAAQIAIWVFHVGAYVMVIGFLFVLNLITGTDWWFYWPAIVWGIVLAAHTSTTFGRRMDDDWQERRAQGWSAKGRGWRTKPQRFDASGASQFGSDVVPVQLTQRAADKIDELRRIARRIPKPAVRRQALELLAASDQVVAALSDGSGNEAMARTFLDRYLGPMSVILERYQRLAARDIASAEPVLRRVEEHDLPLLNRRVRELHDKLHQGDVIDLQVASEMLAFELDEPDPSGPALDSASRVSETRS